LAVAQGLTVSLPVSVISLPAFIHLVLHGSAKWVK
jgi:hypothetical protein